MEIHLFQFKLQQLSHQIALKLRLTLKKQNIVDSVQLTDQEKFVYDMQLNSSAKTLFIKCTLHESFMDSVTIFMSVSYKDELLKILEEKND